MNDSQTSACDHMWDKALSLGLVRWESGMRTRFGWVVLRANGPRCLAAPDSGGVCVWRDATSWRLDWSDSATRGCVLAAARRSTGDERLYVEWPDALEGHCCAVAPTLGAMYEEEDTEIAALLRVVLR